MLEWLALPALLLCTPPAIADATPFPLVPQSGPNGVGWVVQPDLLDALESKTEVTFSDLSPLAGWRIDVELSRLPIVTTDAALYIDGSPVGRPGEGLTLWTGTITGEPESHVYFAFSAHGCRGLLRDRDHKVELKAIAGPGGDWTNSHSQFVEFSDAAQGVNPSSFCRATELSKSISPSESSPWTRQQQPIALGTPTLYECRIAIETDYQYYQLFNNVAAAEAYALTLFGAVSDRYMEQIGTILTMNYFSVYSSNNDPWQEQDTGGDCLDALFEFQEAWDNNAAPVNADLYHLLSGANLGCGVGYLDVLCDQDYGFSLSGNLHGGTDFPVSPGDDTWDFIVMSHELGHNFGAPHTHDYCPPIDQCAPSGYFGMCQNTQSCISNGTLMSYCHLCSGGYKNINLTFHSQVVNTMRSEVLSSCLQPFEGITTNVNLGFALAGSNGLPHLDVDYLPNGTLRFDTTSAPSQQAGVLVVSPNLLQAPFANGTFVPGFDLFLPVFTDATGTNAVVAPLSGISLPSGATFYTQAWFNDPAGPFPYSSTNGVEFLIILP